MKSENQNKQGIPSYLTTNGFFLWTPWLHSFIEVNFHLMINKRSSVSLPPFIRVSLLIDTVMVLVLSNGECVLLTPQVSGEYNRS